MKEPGKQVLLPHKLSQLGPALVKGDVNGDAIVNILDVVMLVNFVLGSDNPTTLEQNAADYNQDGVLNILDVVSTVNIILG